MILRQWPVNYIIVAKMSIFFYYNFILGNWSILYILLCKGQGEAEGSDERNPIEDVVPATGGGGIPRRKTKKERDQIYLGRLKCC